jgi:hypothetical protein
VYIYDVPVFCESMVTNLLCLLTYIVLEVEGIEPRHCKLNFSSGSVSLIVEDGLCNINSEEIDGTRDLNHGE